MSTSSKSHGFTRVDQETTPSAWVSCLDTLHQEPFYREYKAQIRAILSPQPSGLYLDLGSGVGVDALAISGVAIGVDLSLTMCRESRARGLARSVVAASNALPLPASLVDGCWSDRTFQHLEHPRQSLDELVRVMKPGATIVIADPDYSTQAMEFPDQRLAEKVFDYRAKHALRNGTLAHQMERWFVDACLEDVSSEVRTLAVCDPHSVDNVMGLRSWARSALDQGLMRADEVLRWEAMYDEVVAQERFRWSVSFFITRGRKPAVQQA